MISIEKVDSGDVAGVSDFSHEAKFTEIAHVLRVSPTDINDAVRNARLSSFIGVFSFLALLSLQRLW